MSTTQVVNAKPLTITSHEIFAIMGYDMDAADIFEECLERFLDGDWGDVTATDARANNVDLVAGGRLLGAYSTSHGRIWIIANAVDDPDEARRITLCTPEEY
jgi:hypothetical protein